MDIKRFYADANSCNSDNVTIVGDEFYHMTKVLRHKVGYKIIVSNNLDGKDYHCEITALHKDCATAKVEQVVENECKTRVAITLCQALPKGDKIDWIVQKAVELGVGNINIFNSAYVSENRFNMDRLDKINIEACKQCGRSRIANIRGLMTYTDMLRDAQSNDLIIFAYENEVEQDIKRVISENRDINSVAIIIGSEGGFSIDEVCLARESGAKVVTLGSRIMRCETASIICTGLIMYELGEMSR